MVRHTKQAKLVASLTIMGFFAMLASWLLFSRNARVVKKVSVQYADGRTMYTEVRDGQFTPFGPGMSLGEIPLQTGEYRDGTGNVISRVANGTGIRVIHYASGELRSIEFYSAGKRSGPSLNFLRSGMLASYGFFDESHRPHGPFATYSATGHLKRLDWFIHGNQCAMP